MGLWASVSGVVDTVRLSLRDGSGEKEGMEAV
jgi:hypothetical protein